MKLFLVLLSTVLFSCLSSAYSGGGGSGDHAFSFGFGYAGASQSDLNSYSSAMSASSAQLTSGYEFSVTYIYRFSSSMFALALRPSYMTETGSGGGVNNSVTGILFYPMLRLYPLENGFIHFYIQGGVGWGQLTGTSSFGANSVSYAGTDFGAMAGLGAEFCFTDHQCMVVEGDARYHAIPRSLVTSTTGNMGGGLSGTSSHELEFNGLDVQNTLSGIQGILAYTLKF